MSWKIQVTTCSLWTSYTIRRDFIYIKQKRQALCDFSIQIINGKEYEQKSHFHMKKDVEPSFNGN